MLNDFTILLSASNSPPMPGLLSCFRHNGERNIRLAGIDMSSDPSAKYMVDSFYQVPVASDPNYCDIVLDICGKEKVDIYFPTISAEVEAVTKRRQDFADIGTIISAADAEAVTIANNKLRMYEMLEKNGVPGPAFYGVHSKEDFAEGCRRLGYPNKAVCLKIVDGSGSRGVRIIDANRNRYQIFVSEKPNSFFTSYEDMLSILARRRISTSRCRWNICPAMSTRWTCWQTTVRCFMRWAEITSSA